MYKCKYEQPLFFFSDSNKHPASFPHKAASHIYPQKVQKHTTTNTCMEENCLLEVVQK